MRSSSPLPILVLWAVLMVGIPAAHANFVFLDATFDAKPVGAGLGRGGALKGEPIEGIFDSHSEVVVLDSGTDHSIQCVDTSNLAGTNDQLFFQFLDGAEVSDGILHVSGKVTPDALDTFLFDLRQGDLLTGQFFHLSWDGAGLIYWGDGDTVISAFDTYTAGVEVEVELIFDLDAGTYDFIYDGTTILTAEPHGVAGGIGSLVVGNQFDGNNTGSVRYDDLVVWWEPGTANPWLTANFNNKPIGLPIGTGGPAVGEPISVDSSVQTEVKFGVTPTRSLEIRDDSATQAGFVSFEFLNGETLGLGSASVTFDILFEQLQNASVRMFEPAGATAKFCAIHWNDLGDVWVSDQAGTLVYQSTYAAQTRIEVGVWFNAELGSYSLWIDGDRVLRRRDHGITTEQFGRLIFGHEFDADLIGAFRVDNIEVQYIASVLTAVGPDLPATDVLATLHPAAPNPFNPQTTLRYELDLPGAVRLAVFDSRGRRVATLVDGTQAAGSHAISWDGRDVAGRSVSSGVYRAILVAGGGRQMVPMTLVK